MYQDGNVVYFRRLTMTGSRLFRRVKFVADTEVTVGGETHRAELVDIALKGALVAMPEGMHLGEGLPCRLTIFLNDTDFALPFEGETVYSRENLTGIKFTRINIDSMIHLRRLLELNTADPDHVRSELASFIDTK
jgi:hypothetical protein